MSSMPSSKHVKHLLNSTTIRRGSRPPIINHGCIGHQLSPKLVVLHRPHTDVRYPGSMMTDLMGMEGWIGEDRMMWWWWSG